MRVLFRYSLVGTLLWPAISTAQLFAGSNSIIYDKGELLYVKEAIELSAGANLYLRNEGQLLQGTSGISQNKGTGRVSVFQEGTSNNFAFNYWCAPVGNASGSSGNEPFGISMLSRPVSATVSTPAATITNDSDGWAMPLMIAANWIHTLQSSSTYSGWTAVGASPKIQPGLGFTMKGTAGTDATVAEGNGIQNNPGSAQRYDFRGKPNDGNIQVPVSPGNFTLTGNPYPSALHLNAFLLDPANTACTGIAYFWEQDKSVNTHVLQQYRGGYGTYAPINTVSEGVYVPATFNTYNADGTVNTVGTSSNLSINRRFSPIGQGFMIRGAASGSVVTLKNSHRLYYKESSSARSYFNRSPVPQQAEADSITQQVPLIRINTSMNNEFSRQLALVLLHEATMGLDFGIDAAAESDNLPNDLFFDIEGGNYVIQGVPFSSGLDIPLSIIATGSTTFGISVAEVVNFDPLQPIYLYDNLFQTYHDIHEGTYQLHLEEGRYTNRFSLRFQQQGLGLGDENTNRISVYRPSGVDEIRIYNPDLLPIGNIVLIDMNGKEVIIWKEGSTAGNISIPTTSVSEGFYILMSHTSTGHSISRKVLVSR